MSNYKFEVKLTSNELAELLCQYKDLDLEDLGSVTLHKWNHNHDCHTFTVEASLDYEIVTHQLNMRECINKIIAIKEDNTVSDIDSYKQLIQNINHVVEHLNQEDTSKNLKLIINLEKYKLKCLKEMEVIIK